MFKLPHSVLLVTLLWSACSFPAQAGPLVYIDGALTAGSVTPVREYLEKRLQDTKSAEEIDVLINSPGGGVVAGMSLVNQMTNLRAAGITINCYVLDMAASMAFQLLTQCSNRVVLASSFLLWHGVRVQTMAPITSEYALAMSDGLKQLDALILLQLESSLDIEPSVVRHHFDRETLWNGYTLSQLDPDFLTVVPAFPSILRRIPGAIRTRELSLFDFFGGTGVDGEFMYIWNSWKQHTHTE